MSKHLSFLLLGTACMYFAELKAQNWVNGGNTLTANGTLGTNSSHSISFETANIARGILTNTGRWNLGATTTPAAKVQITYNGAPGDPQLLLYEPANDYARLYFKNTNTSAYFGIAASPATSGSSARLNFLYSPVGDIMTIRGDKRVGIGTTNPAATLHVVGNSYFTGNVGIGTTTPSYKMHVVGKGFFSDGLDVDEGIFSRTFSASGTAVIGWGGSSGIMGRGTDYGVHGTGTNSVAYGVYGEGYYGVYGKSTVYGVFGSSDQVGVLGQGGTYGLSGTGTTSNSTGVFGQGGTGVYGSGSTYGILGQSSNYAGYFSGKVHATGGYTSGSDRKLKQNISDLGSAIDIINKLQPKAYEYRQDGDFQLMNLPRGKHFGLIAQDLEEVLPDLVQEIQFNTAIARTPLVTSTMEENKEVIIDYKAVNYMELIPILVKGMQEQQHVMNQQQQRIEKLEQLVKKLSNGQGLNNYLSSAQLSEVIPNPVKGTATVQYSIPEGKSRAQLLITDVLGRQMITLQLSSLGVINFDTSSLASGMYNYSLIVDNKTVATRKMTVVK